MAEVLRIAEPVEPASNPSLPQNIEAEAALLGALMIDNRLVEDVQLKLRAEHFYEPAWAYLRSGSEDDGRQPSREPGDAPSAVRIRRVDKRSWRARVFGAIDRIGRGRNWRSGLRATDLRSRVAPGVDWRWS